MDRNQIAEVIRKRLNLENEDWATIRNNPKFQRLFQAAIEASKYRLVAEIIESEAYDDSGKRSTSDAYSSPAALNCSSSAWQNAWR